MLRVQVQALFPQYPLAVLIRDLTETRSSDLTVDNILEGRLPPPTPPFTPPSDIPGNIRFAFTVTYHFQFQIFIPAHRKYKLIKEKIN